MVAELRARRDLLVAGLDALPGVSCATPQGAFYAFPDVTGVGIDADTLADRLLEEAGVAVLAGGAFGAAGAGNLRLSYRNGPARTSRRAWSASAVAARRAVSAVHPQLATASRSRRIGPLDSRSGTPGAPPGWR